MRTTLLTLIILIIHQSTNAQQMENTIENTKMKVEIWSDIVCPWCYIGKRKFEMALNEVEFKEFIEVEYKSYQLDPNMETDTSKSIAQYLSDAKGISLSDAEKMGKRVSQVASSVGLQYDLSKTIPINTLQAHGLLHYAKSKGKQLELKERLMKAYFIETLNLDDTDILVRLATEIGLDKIEAESALINNTYKDAVQKEIYEGVQLGLTGVPFFVFDRKIGISGAQAPGTFKKALKKSYADWSKNQTTELKIIDGKVCKPNGKCE